ncbi:hypothetical protein HS5_14440 [Acidianus sp. HS-5]|nr:hypothetical protein HS5_14440 [Acidianus sp. HS-5]
MVVSEAAGVLVPPSALKQHVVPGIEYCKYGPYLGSMIFLWNYTNNDQIYECFLSGNIQLINAVPSSEFLSSCILALKELSTVSVYDDVTYSFLFFQVNFKYYPENNTYFRWALSSLINPEFVESQILCNGLKGVPSGLYICPSVFPCLASNSTLISELYNIYTTHESYCPKRACQYLKDAGLVYSSSLGEWTYPNGTPVSIPIYVQEDFYNCPAWIEMLKTDACQIHFGKNLDIITYPPSCLVTDLLSLKYGLINFGYLSYTALIDDDYHTLGPLAPSCSLNCYVNSTVNAQFTAAYVKDSNLSQALVNLANALVDLQWDEPWIILGWNTCITPAITNNYYGYVTSPDEGYTFTYTDIHEGNTITGKIAESMGTTGYEAPNFDILYCNFFSSSEIWDLGVPTPLTVPPNDPTPLALQPCTATYNVVPIHNVTVEGHKIVNGEEIIYCFVHNATYINGRPLTALDYNFSIWYFDMPGYCPSNNPLGLNLNHVYIGNYLSIPVYVNYTEIASYPMKLIYGSMPGLVYSCVPANNPYKLILYFNATGFCLLDASDEYIVPPCLYLNYKPCQYNPSYPSHVCLACNGELPGGFPWYIYEWNYSIGAIVKPFVGNFRWNPLSCTYNVTAGSTATVTTNINQIITSPYIVVTQTGKLIKTAPKPCCPIANATGYAEVWAYGSTKPIEKLTLTHVSGNQYEVSVPTSGLTPNTFYVVFINATYEAPVTVDGHVMMLPHYAYRWYAVYPYSPVTVKPTVSPISNVTTIFKCGSKLTSYTPPTPPSVVVNSSLVTYTPPAAPSVSSAVIAMIGITVILALVGVVILIRFK